LLRSGEAFKIYLTCLQQAGGSSASIDDAVRRRDELLQSQEAAAPAAPQTSETVPTTSAEATGPTETTGTPSSLLASQTPSQQIAQQVLSQSTASAAGIPPNPPLKAPFGESGPQDPIQVTIVERVYLPSPGMTSTHTVLGKGSWVPRLVRFVVLVAVSSFCMWKITVSVTTG